MRIWIVDDSHKHAKEAASAILREVSADILVNDDISWPDDSPLPKLKSALNNQQSIPGMPNIVVLDLLVESDQRDPFAGQSFYHRLRTEEKTRGCWPPAYVIIWSQYRGTAETEDFVTSCKHTDRRVLALEQKIPEKLAEKVRECLQMIEDGD